jgi:glycosyltransferase involved in cell wall biosynthesis
MTAMLDRNTALNNDTNKSLEATVVISTKNRCEELRVALDSCLSQTGDHRILVVNDGSEDSTQQVLVDNYPSATVVNHAISTGLVVARNLAARVAEGDVIFSIDDDASFTTSRIITTVLREFEDPRIGAVAIPYADINRDGVERQRTPDESDVWVTDRFIGTAHAVRKDVFLKLGGYREFLFHQGEESDFCIRLLEAGYFVRLGNSDRIDHYESPKRDTKRMDLYGRRNDVLFAVLNVPWPWFPLHLISVTIKGIWFGLRIGRPLRMLQGLVFGYASGLKYWSQRKPVSPKTYRLFRRLRKDKAVALDAAYSELGQR